MKSEFKSEYDDLVEDFNAALRKVVAEVSTAMEEAKIPLSLPIESRIKSWGSIKEKLARLDLAISSIISLDDIIGVRVVTLFKSDAERARWAINKRMSVKKEIIETARHLVDSFGYGSDHYIVEAGNRFRAEIQVRTLSQHIWAEASHRLYYKNEGVVPRELRRSIHRTSALLEVVDSELERLRQEREDFVKEISGFDDDVDDDFGIFDISEDEELSVLGIQILLDQKLPPKYWSENDHYLGLLTELLHLGFKTIGELGKVIDENLDEALRIEQEEMKLRLKDPGVSEEVKIEMIETGRYCTEVALVRTMLIRKFGARYRVFDPSKWKKQ